MNDLITSLNIESIPDWGLLIVAAILGTCFAYWRKWAWSDIDYPMLGTRKDRAKAITKLIGMIAVALTVDMQAGMTDTAVIVLGIGIGLAVPVEVQKEELKRNEEIEVTDGRVEIERSAGMS